ncbi:hypothetical protein E2C01_088024 [Portunus trituberculatus]|uniref:Uncharacterized protein n=1 Tax=Portunus trituberculatus TaxID=210409 RepID=A0A5B7J9N8_PORTR|nr:hypothetical protein [Portunus trituberculatus]MPC92912.1 hypothetical protein [Portunus trituberculatus]
MHVEANNLFMCLSGVRVSCIITPRSFSSLLFIIASFPVLYSHVSLLLLLPIAINCHFLVLNSNFHFWLYFQILCECYSLLSPAGHPASLSLMERIQSSY